MRNYTVFKVTRESLQESFDSNYGGRNLSADGTLVIRHTEGTPIVPSDPAIKPSYVVESFPNFPNISTSEVKTLIAYTASTSGASDGWKYNTNTKIYNTSQIYENFSRSNQGFIDDINFWYTIENPADIYFDEADTIILYYNSVNNWYIFGNIIRKGVYLNEVSFNKDEITKINEDISQDAYLNLTTKNKPVIQEEFTGYTTTTDTTIQGIETDVNGKMPKTGSTDTNFEVNTISGQSGTFWGDYRVEGKLWVETIRRVKQEANQIIVRVDQDSGLGGGNYAGLTILNPTGATTGATSGNTYYALGVNKDGVLIAGWSGDTQPVARGVYGSEYQLASALAETTTTSATPQSKVTMTTTDLPSGTYKIFTGWIAAGSSAQNDMIFDVTVNGTPQGTNPTMNIESKDALTTNTLSRTFYLQLSGVNDIVLRYWSESSAITTMSDATIELIRVE